MPLKRQPISLYQRCLEKSIYAVLTEWRNTINAETSLFSETLPKLPPVVLNNLVNEAIRVFVDSANYQGTDKLNADLDTCFADLLACLLSSRLTLLNLNSIADLETIPHVDLPRSEYVIFASIPYLINLVSISFKANRDTHTITIPGNRLLKEISRNCPKLKSLDVSYNHTVTNVGLQYLCDSVDNGHLKLQKLSLFGCAVTADGVAKVLKHLTSLRYVGYKETGTALMRLQKKSSDLKLNLTYLNNMGCGMKTLDDIHELYFNCKTSHIIFDTCPYMNEIKVHVIDATLEHAVLGKNITSLHLMFDIVGQSGIGRGLMNVIGNYGHQLTTLSLVCSRVKMGDLLTVGRQCESLNTFTIKCREISEQDSFVDDTVQQCNANKYFSNLENLFLTILTDNQEYTGANVLPYIVCSNSLKCAYFSLNSTLLTDLWVEQKFLTVFDTNNIESLIFDVPSNGFSYAKLSLTVVSVENIFNKCPLIKILGNLFTWSISKEEMKELCGQLEHENSDLELIYHPVPVFVNMHDFD